MRKGFTLIELLVVITILAVLAGAALPFVQGYVEDARIAKAKADLDEISRALAVYEMREGEYATTSVSLLTGRYLNKSSVDPWGQAYSVATSTGIVYSGGPDKTLLTTEDNISVYYTPPLALVSAKWVDSNQSGSIDKQSPADKIILNFSRILDTGTQVAIAAVGNLDACLQIDQGLPGAVMETRFDHDGSTNAAYATKVTNDRKGIVLTVDQDAIMNVKSDTIRVKIGQVILKDMAATSCLSGQDVTVIEQ